MTPQTRISPKFVAKDWEELRPSLDDQANGAAWAQAVDIFHDRIASRFLEPVDRLGGFPESSDLGFGFAMLALDCLLIDTIQSFREGWIKGSEARTARAFVDFFRASNGRFGSVFSSRRLIDEFYGAIRCGLMHDGETRKGWRVRRRTHRTEIVEKSDGGYVLYRDNFHEALKAEFEAYKKALTDGRSSALRDNFLARMDTISGLAVAQPDAVLYFAYGSNMNQNQMHSRISSTTFAGIARLEGYRVCFNKAGVDGSAKANVETSAGEDSFVLGCLYEVSESEFAKLKGIEKGYTDIPVRVDQGGAKVEAQTFVADTSAVLQGTPSTQYLSTILEGAQTLGLPKEYIDSLRTCSSKQL